MRGEDVAAVAVVATLAAGAASCRGVACAHRACTISWCTAEKAAHLLEAEAGVGGVADEGGQEARHRGAEAAPRRAAEPTRSVRAVATPHADVWALQSVLTRRHRRRGRACVSRS